MSCPVLANSVQVFSSLGQMPRSVIVGSHGETVSGASGIHRQAVFQHDSTSGVLTV
jgi:hypothetical protein